HPRRSGPDRYIPPSGPPRRPPLWREVSATQPHHPTTARSPPFGGSAGGCGALHSIPTRPGRVVFLSRAASVDPHLTTERLWPAETCASLSPSPARSASGATTRRTRASATILIASRCASTASGAGAIAAIGRPASRGGSVVARDRQRAKQRKARRAGQKPGPARSEPYRADLPGELEHASGEADEFDAALV